VQVHARQHLSHLGGLSSPRWQDRAGEAHLLSGHLIDPAVIDPRSLDLKGPCSGDERPSLSVPIAHHEPRPVLVQLSGEARHVGVYLGFEGGSQHAPCPFGHDCIKTNGEFRVRGAINLHSQHRRSFLPASHRRRTCFGRTGRYAASPFRWCIHRYWFQLTTEPSTSTTNDNESTNPALRTASSLSPRRSLLQRRTQRILDQGGR
jgi:hypothetical protein